MPRISFHQNKKKEIEVSAGTNLMQALLQADIPVASSCHGDGVCAKCKIQIVTGHQNLSAPNETEQLLKLQNHLGEPYRISCQTQVLGDVCIDTGYW